MFYLTRRQAHAALAGVVAAAGYLAAAELGSRKPVRVSGLLTLGAVAMAGMAGASLNNKASVKANAAHQRIDTLVPVIATASTNASNAVASVANKYDKTGGTISGTVTVTGDHHIQGSLFGTGGTLSVGDNIDATNNTLSRVFQLSPADGNARVQVPAGIGVTAGVIAMNGNDITTCGHISPTEIGPGGTRADLSGTQTLATLTTRSNFHNQTLNNAKVCY